jgi:hypothetical protein
MEKIKYLVRPDDYHIFEIDESNGCYRSYSIKAAYSDGARVNAYPHFTFENLTKNYEFFPIQENELPLYEEIEDVYTKYYSWSTRTDGHGGIKGGTLEEYVKRFGKSIKDEVKDILLPQKEDKNDEFVAKFVNWLRDNYSTYEYNKPNKPLHYSLWRKDFSKDEFFTVEQLWVEYKIKNNY